MGTRLLHGRVFSESDRSNTPHVALVSAALADKFLSGSAVGQRLLINDNNKGPRPIEIVGVVENVRQAALDLPPAFDIYIPLRQIHPDGVALLRNNQFWMIKTDSDPAAFRTTFLAHLRAVDPDAAVSSTGAMRQYLDAWLGPRRFNLGLFGAFALTAVLLAVSGLYGLVAYAVSQRAQEIGLRMAIGATERDVQRMILRQAAGLGVTGAAVGLCLAGAVRPLISGMVQDVSIRSRASGRNGGIPDRGRSAGRCGCPRAARRGSNPRSRSKHSEPRPLDAVPRAAPARRGMRGEGCYCNNMCVIKLTHGDAADVEDSWRVGARRDLGAVARRLVE